MANESSVLRGQDLPSESREIIRNFADGKRITKSQRDWLWAMGFANKTNDKFTKLGKRLHSEIIGSGDGPESLKDLLRF